MADSLPDTQRAYVFTEYGGPENQELTEIAVPTPGNSEVLVEVHAAGVNPVDFKLREGHVRAVVDKPLPVPLGNEAAGVVRAVGQDVEGLAVGDEVFGYVAPQAGAYAEYAVLDGGFTAKKPSEVSWTDAATLPIAAATAYDALVQLGLRSGQTLLINGIGGGVGVFAAQLARDQGIGVFGTAGEDKRELVESLGAVLFPYGGDVAARVRASLPDGVHAILDLVGGDALRAVSELSSRIVTTADPTTAAEVGGAMVERDRTRGPLEAVAALVASGKVSPLVHEVMPLEQAGQALAAVEKGHARGKVVIQVR